MLASQHELAQAALARQQRKTRMPSTWAKVPAALAMEEVIDRSFVLTVLMAGVMKGNKDIC